MGEDEGRGRGTRTRGDDTGDDTGDDGGEAMTAKNILLVEDEDNIAFALERDDMRQSVLELLRRYGA